MTKSKSKPPRSPDLNPLDYFLWGYQKSLVYITPIENENDLRNRIVAPCETIRNTPGIFEHVHQFLRRRLGMYRGARWTFSTIHLIVLFHQKICVCEAYFCFSVFD